MYAAAAAVIMFATLKSAAKIKAVEIDGLPERLIKLSHDWQYPTAQIYSLKVFSIQS